jgi:hypothetical protein
VIFDDKFETVHSLPPDKPLDQQWATIFRLGCECFADIDYDENDNPILLPMSDIIKSYEEEKANQPRFEPIDVYNGNVYDGVDQTNTLHDDNNAGMHVPGGVFENASSKVVPVPAGGETAADGHDADDGLQYTSTRPRRNVGTYKQGPAKIQNFPIDGESYDFSFISDANVKPHQQTKYHPQKLSKALLAECYLMQQEWKEDDLCALASNAILDSWEPNGEHTISEVVDPRLLATKSVTSNTTTTTHRMKLLQEDHSRMSSGKQ